KTASASSLPSTRNRSAASVEGRVSTRYSSSPGGSSCASSASCSSCCSVWGVARSSARTLSRVTALVVIRPLCPTGSNGGRRRLVGPMAGARPTEIQPAGIQPTVAPSAGGSAAQRGVGGGEAHVPGVPHVHAGDRPTGEGAGEAVEVPLPAGADVLDHRGWHVVVAQRHLAPFPRLSDLEGERPGLLPHRGAHGEQALRLAGVDRERRGAGVAGLGGHGHLHD